MVRAKPGRPRAEAALRRGPSLHIRLPADELAQAARDAAARGLSLAAHVRDLLRAYAGLLKGG